MTVEAEIRAAFADAGVRGWLHARPVTGPAPAVAVDADEPVPLASVYKLPLLTAFLRAVDDGDIDPRERTDLDPTERTPGPTGVSALADPVTASWRDLATLMITVSDNAAADALLARVGLARVEQTVSALGLTGTRVVGGTAGVLADLVAETGADDPGAALAAIADLDVPVEPSAYDPLRTSTAPARELTALLADLWTDRAASAEGCAFARDVLARRFGPYRIRHGFLLDSVEVADKTGSLGALRHDVGVVTYPSGPPVAVAVLTRAARAGGLMARVDAVIGATARLAVDAVRSAAD